MQTYAPRNGALRERLRSQPELLPHFMAIKGLLRPEENAKIPALVDGLDDDEQEWLIEELNALSADHAATMLRSMLAELNEAKTATDPQA